MIVIMVCSFMLKGPGLRVHLMPKKLNWRVGNQRAIATPNGYETNWATMEVI